MSHPIVTRKDYFLSEADIRKLLGISKDVHIVEVRRQTFAWGKDKRATLDNLGFVVSVIEAP